MPFKSVDVEIDLEDFDDDEIIEYILRRGYKVLISREKFSAFGPRYQRDIEKLNLTVFDEPNIKEDLAEVLAAIRAKQTDKACWLIERLIEPKFKTLTDCEELYKKLRPTNSDGRSP